MSLSFEKLIMHIHMLMQKSKYNGENNKSSCNHESGHKSKGSYA